MLLTAALPRPVGRGRRAEAVHRRADEIGNRYHCRPDLGLLEPRKRS